MAYHIAFTMSFWQTKKPFCSYKTGPNFLAGISNATQRLCEKRFSKPDNLCFLLPAVRTFLITAELRSCVKLDDPHRDLRQQSAKTLLLSGSFFYSLNLRVFRDLRGSKNGCESVSNRSKISANAAVKNNPMLQKINIKSDPFFCHILSFFAEKCMFFSFFRLFWSFFFARKSSLLPLFVPETNL